MTWEQAKIKATSCDNLPLNITNSEKNEYIRLQTEVFFNEYHGINSGYTEYARNAKHRIIADCMYRGHNGNVCSN